MPFRFAALLVVYLAYILSSGVGTKQGSGCDPWGLTSPSQDSTSQPAACLAVSGGLLVKAGGATEPNGQPTFTSNDPTGEAGGGVDPNGRK